ncbi:hypothetical protein LguiB_010307 [Lonicera macranthoides]
MMGSLGITTSPSRSLRPISSVFITTSGPTYISSTTPLIIASYPRQRRTNFGFLAVGEHSKLRVHAYESGNVIRQQEFWEDPAEDSESESEDEGEEAEENDLNFESDWETERDASMITDNVDKLSTSKYEEDLVREVEQLLGPEERAILQQNKTPNLDKISTAKWNPLHTLALAGQIRFMDGLLDNGLDIDIVDKDGMTVLHKAIIGKKEAVISHLLRKGASPNVRDKDGATPLHYAIQVGAMQTVKLLLIKYKADVNIADNEGWTPLHVAVQVRNRDLVKVLLLNGADKTRRTKDGITALDISLCYGKDFKSYDLAKLLKLVPANRY